GSEQKKGQKSAPAPPNLHKNLWFFENKKGKKRKPKTVRIPTILAPRYDCAIIFYTIKPIHTYTYTYLYHSAKYELLKATTQTRSGCRVVQCEGRQTVEEQLQLHRSKPILEEGKRPQKGIEKDK
uniref:Uncharacterized protein n=1 Tax=Anopheles arabiensis TaxID=7173 RepID=A0A182IGA5_ANOAR